MPSYSFCLSDYRSSSRMGTVRIGKMGRLSSIISRLLSALKLFSRLVNV